MDKQQIIEYLNAVCDAEGVVQSCNDTIAIYQREKGRTNNPSMPAKPVMESVVMEKWKEDHFIAFWILSVVFFFLFYILIALILHAFGMGNDVLGAVMIISAVLAMVTSKCSLYFIDKIKREKEYAAKLEVERKKYNKEYQEYQKQCTIYDKACMLRKETFAMLDAAIQQEQLHKQKAEKKLEQLYQRDVIYASFRNLIAAYQIREYLQMGICDSLEGANGAYAQYMQDVRTERICTSIDKLKSTIASAIQQLQGTLIGELQNINQSIENTRISIQNGTNSISSKLETMQRESIERIEANYQDARQILSNMKENIAVSAHNQYVEQRMNGVEGYLLRHPVD